MSACEWTSLQTRTLEDNHNINSHSYIAKKNSFFITKNNSKTRDENKCMYEAESFPILITLLNTRKNTTYQYNSVGTIVSALETYQTIINFK